jgi:hypothetical protein
VKKKLLLNKYAISVVGLKNECKNVFHARKHSFLALVLEKLENENE